MGRFSDDGNYTVDIDEGTLSRVRQIRIADFIKETVANRRLIDSLWLELISFISLFVICLGLIIALPTQRHILLPL